MKKIYVFSKYAVSNNNAGPKAKCDIEEIIKKNYNSINYTYKANNNKFYDKIIQKILILRDVKKNDKKDNVLIFQFPFSNFIYSLVKKAKKIVFIHDIDGLRFLDEKKLKKEINSYNNSDVIISHNEIMTNFLIKNGVKENKIINLELFDYLLSGVVKSKDNSNKDLEVVYCGNLQKATFLQDISTKKIDYILNLYGNKVNFKNNNIKYFGSFSPEELIYQLSGKYGLIWDGKSDDSDSNEPLKNYTKYNNPHKLSCYIAAGFPVIVWSKSAISKFVTDNNIGYVIDNLDDIKVEMLDNYEIHKKNVELLSNRVRTGYYTITAFDKALKKIK